MGIAGLGVAVCTAFASGLFIVALNHATVANVLFMQAVSPIAAALLAWIALGEPVTARAGVAMVVALLGVSLMVGGPGSGGLLGVGAAAGMTLSYSVAIVITRHRRDISMTPAICLSQLMLVLVVGPLAAPGTVGRHDVVFLVLLGVGQMGLGLVLFAMGARLIVASEIALITLLEVVLGPFWAWVAVSEKPALMTVVGGAVVVAAVLLQTTGTGLSRRRASARLPRSLPAPAASPAPDPSGTESGATRRRRE
jgi:drug/metabolite transporter (DMT)-like permease